MLAVIERLKSRFDVYCCMSSQAVKGQRSKQNARFLKSLFLDVDVKPGTFATPVEALQALNLFRGAVGLPRPTLVVRAAGLTGGFHCHWILDRPLSKDKWLPLAKALKEVVKQHKLAVDLGVIADPARLLRVPGTINHKYTDQRLVVLHPSIVERDYAVDEITGPLQPYMNASRRSLHSNSAAATTDTLRTIAPPGAPRARMSKLFAGMAGVNDALGAGRFNFVEFKDAVEFLTGKGWFGEHQYDHMLALALPTSRSPSTRMRRAPSISRPSTRPDVTQLSMSNGMPTPFVAPATAGRFKLPERSSTGRTSRAGPASRLSQSRRLKGWPVGLRPKKPQRSKSRKRASMTHS